MYINGTTKTVVFLSTLSLRRATCIIDIVNNVIDHFYPRSPCGERLIREPTSARDNKFLSTLSLRRATNINSSVNTADQISIHALLAESDKLRNPSRPGKINFYPRSPCGERPHITHKSASSLPSFLSTLSLRRATWLRCWQLAARDISIHALLAESDSRPIFFWRAKQNFYPRSPCGERHETTLYKAVETQISIHALLAESDA